MIPPGISKHPIGNADPILFAAGLAAAVDRLIDDTAAGEGIAGKIVVTVFPGNIKAAEDIRHVLREPAPALCLQDGRHAVKGLRDAPGDAGQGIAIAAEGNGSTDDIFEIRPLQKGSDRFRHRLLAALIVIIARPDLVTGAGEVITELLHNVSRISPLLRPVLARKIALEVASAPLIPSG